MISLSSELLAAELRRIDRLAVRIDDELVAIRQATSLDRDDSPHAAAACERTFTLRHDLGELQLGIARLWRMVNDGER